MRPLHSALVLAVCVGAGVVRADSLVCRQGRRRALYRGTQKPAAIITVTEGEVVSIVFED